MLRVIALLALLGCAISITYKNYDFPSGLTAVHKASTELATKIEQNQSFGHLKQTKTEIDAEVLAFSYKILATLKERNLTTEDLHTVDKKTEREIGTLWLKYWKELSPGAQAYFIRYEPRITEIMQKFESELASYDNSVTL